MKKLIIWDFDGVIADTEKLWLKNRQILMKEALGIDWDWETVNHYLRGTGILLLCLLVVFISLLGIALNGSETQKNITLICFGPHRYFNTFY